MFLERKVRNVLFNATLTFYLWKPTPVTTWATLFDWRGELFTCPYPLNACSPQDQKPDLWSRIAARVLLCAPSYRWDNTYHSLCYTSRGALAGTRKSMMDHTMSKCSTMELYHAPLCFRRHREYYTSTRWRRFILQ